MIYIYRFVFPFAFLFFLPGLIIKLIRRSGRKSNYMERFAIFSQPQKNALEAMKGAVWIHAVSVGETNVALSLLKKWISQYPDRKFVFSTTTTTAQEIAWNKVPDGVKVFFCPIDFTPFVQKTLKLIQPSALVILETEIWPNMVTLARQSGTKVFLVNGRISDHSVKGYLRLRKFFSAVLSNFNCICVQTPLDAERFHAIEPALNVVTTGNIKFDQLPPADLRGIELDEFFGKGFIPVLACSTHSPEEKMMIDSYMKVHQSIPNLKLVIVPRHAERGSEIEAMLQSAGLSYYRRTSGKSVSAPVDCLLADTTGELLKFIASSEIILMGKTFAGNNEGQNIIEPANLKKAIITGPEMRNFKQAFASLQANHGVMVLQSDTELAEAILSLASNPSLRNELGTRAEQAMAEHAGAIQKTITALESALSNK